MWRCPLTLQPPSLSPDPGARPNKDPENITSQLTQQSLRWPHPGRDLGSSVEGRGLESSHPRERAQGSRACPFPPPTDRAGLRPPLLSSSSQHSLAAVVGKMADMSRRHLCPPYTFAAAVCQRQGCPDTTPRGREHKGRGPGEGGPGLAGTHFCLCLTLYSPWPCYCFWDP